LRNDQEYDKTTTISLSQPPIYYFEQDTEISVLSSFLGKSGSCHHSQGPQSLKMYDLLSNLETIYEIILLNSLCQQSTSRRAIRLLITRGMIFHLCQQTSGSEACLLAALDLWRVVLLKRSVTMIFTCPLLSWCKTTSPFRENNNVLVFLFPSWSTCGSFAFKNSFIC
jgi:hypothetical protein